ncbi:dihydroneopterin aldolase [Heyndrickxia ginsengihumi]|uniref:7,8-dihydroneopterin aldolase n=1 Tax=Heyndrickxia ginsengihumi TaxID=363870 RepID=A0A0A6XY31_9BACI|nr:dihydroneopterin aldolase [Heyndrickxia ginsengihumi]KHD85042.1 dihydroneopterin aldolase [Heyndrickxia ginsengihumi]MBE6183241.1 dihydroneopterin aldolase [Bacillus sp. (in: firmicutes)]MCM3024329.1 dihydroneopterin aldolase [Heyndrickxia ginsengihumi]NEY21131.1 dihydroneopterin aldolase [Heyndrickxia ginsengihumi]
MDKIYLNELEFYGFHGVLPEETKLGQRFRVSMTLYLDLKEAGETDNLELTVSYADVYQMVKEIVEGKPYKLIEAVAEKLASSILEAFPTITMISVKVIKPDPPIQGHYQSVAVEILRSRNDD